MTLPGAKSGRSHVRGYSTNDVRSESHDQSPSDSGMGWDGMGRGRKNSSWKPTTDEQPPLMERRAREFEWAAKHLPAEHTGMVVSALIGLEIAGQKQTTGTVMARLTEQGRTAEQRRANERARGRA